MTVSSSTNKVSYSGNGSLTTFAYSFKIFDQGDLTVILRAADGTETTQTITTHYTVSGVGSASGGNVVFGTAPASGVTVVIIREQPLTQGLDLVANDPFPAESLEEALDKLTFMSQKHEEELGRAIKASRTNTLTGSEFTISATDRANKVFSFDSSGDLAVTQELGTFKGNWATSTTYVARDIVKDTSTNNIFMVNTDHTSSGAQPLTTNANSAKYDLIVDAASATTSATNAAASATTATTKASEAATSATNAATSETNAATSATNAATSETNAATSAGNSAGSATNAGTSETNAASSATAAASSATTATTKASDASTSETNAASSATAAASSATAAATSATNAGTSETNAASSATAAASSATTASTKAGEAATSATNAASSATAAASSATSAANSYSSFAAQYRVVSSDPTDSLDAGDLAFNTTSSLLKYYSGSSWQSIAPGIGSLADDSTPQLGGNLDLNSNDITGTGNINITGAGTFSSDLNIADKIVHSGDTNTAIRFPAADTVSFETGGSERARLDSSGNFIVGKTTSTVGTAGTSIESTGRVEINAASTTPLTVSRITDEGDMIQFYEGSTQRGVIGIELNDMFISSTNTGLRFDYNDTRVVPCTTTGSGSDGTDDLGDPAVRWKNIYLSGGVVDTTTTVSYASSISLSYTNGAIQTVTLTGDVTFTDGLADGEAIVLMLNAGASHNVTWTVVDYWVSSGGNAAPTLTAKDTIVLWKIGTDVYAAYAGSFA